MGCDQVVGLGRTRCGDRVCEAQRVCGASDGCRYWLRRADDREAEAAVVLDATRCLASGAHDAITEFARFSASVARATAADIGCGVRMTARWRPRSYGMRPGGWSQDGATKHVFRWQTQRSGLRMF